MKDKFNKEEWYIQQLPYKIAMDIVVNNHYLHRKPPCSIAFGLFNINEPTKIYGCVTYGCPPSRDLQKSICGEDEANNVIELNRLWVSEDVPKNGESFLVSKSIKKLKHEIVVSYADSGYNHVGYIYQAANFYYTGLSQPNKDYYVDGFEYSHSKSLYDKYSTKQLKEIFGDRLKTRERSRKYRYIYINADKRRKKELLHKMKYEILPHPKPNEFMELSHTVSRETESSFKTNYHKKLF